MPSSTSILKTLSRPDSAAMPSHRLPAAQNFFCACAYDFAIRRWSHSRVSMTNQEASDIADRTMRTAIDRLSACPMSFSNPDSAPPMMLSET